MDSKLWAALLAPIIGGAIWWLLLRPGRIVHDWLWRKLPDGRLRRILFQKMDP